MICIVLDTSRGHVELAVLHIVLRSGEKIYALTIDELVVLRDCLEGSVDSNAPRVAIGEARGSGGVTLAGDGIDATGN